QMPPSARSWVLGQRAWLPLPRGAPLAWLRRLWRSLVLEKGPSPLLCPWPCRLRSCLLPGLSFLSPLPRASSMLAAIYGYNRRACKLCQWFTLGEGNSEKACRRPAARRRYLRGRAVRTLHFPAVFSCRYAMQAGVPMPQEWCLYACLASLTEGL